MATKTPMMFVNEWVQKRSADYTSRKGTRSISLDQTNPKFEASITVLPRDASRGLPTYTVTGVGRNKKTAEQDAATNMLKELKLELTSAEGASAFLPAIPSTSTSAAVASSYAPLPELDQKELLTKASAFNSGTALKELCEFRGWKDPEAKFQDFGPAHSKVFVCTIEFLGITEKGTARTKGDAKKLARYKLLTRCNALGKIKRDCANGDQTDSIRYDGRAPCEAELQGRGCYAKVEHVTHQMVREFKTGPQLNILLEATKDFLAQNFVIPKDEVEGLLKAKGESDVVAFFGRLMGELGMTVDKTFFEDDDDSEVAMDFDDDDKSDSESIKSNSSFFSCNSDVNDHDEDDSKDAKNSSQLEPNENLAFECNNGDHEPSFVCHLDCSVISKDSGRPISVSGFGIQSTKTEAYKLAILEILGSVAVLCR